MQKIDPAMQRAVWARVQASLGRPAGDDETLRALLQNEQTGRTACRRLSRRLGGRGGALVLKISAEENAHLRALQTLIFLNTGRCPALPPEPPLSAASEPEELRAALERAEKAAAAYENAALEYPQHAALFQTLAAGERKHASWLVCLTQKYSKK